MNSTQNIVDKIILHPADRWQAKPLFEELVPPLDQVSHRLQITTDELSYHIVVGHDERRVFFFLSVAIPQVLILTDFSYYLSEKAGCL